MSPGGLGLDFNFRLTRFSVCARESDVRGLTGRWCRGGRHLGEGSGDRRVTVVSVRGSREFFFSGAYQSLEYYVIAC